MDRSLVARLVAVVTLLPAVLSCGNDSPTQTAFVFAQIISLGGLFSDLEWGYVLAFAFFIVMMFIRPAGLLARRS